jgi:hypothetical protein
MKTFAKTVTLTSTQVNALAATPINVVPAPQAGYALIPQNLIVAKTSGTAVGSCTSDPIGLFYTGDTDVLIGLDAVSSATRSNLVLATGATAATYTAALARNVAAGSDVYAAKGIDIGANGASISAFDGTLQVTVLFNIVKIG